MPAHPALYPLLPGPPLEIMLPHPSVTSRMSSMSGRQFKAFDSYVGSIETLADEALKDLEPSRTRANIRPILDGQLAREFRDNVPLETRRSAGVFFTGTKLARRLSREILSHLPPNAVIADPACGLGDLLLAAARGLPTGPDLAGTLQIWGNRLMGFDTQPEFVRATKIRLLLLAILRSRQIGALSIPKIPDLFPMIHTHDFLACPEEFARASHILINPPYNQLTAPSECIWGNRKVSAAALFIDTCLSNAAAGARIAAILPDVLRSGSYYEKWRQYVESLAEQVEITTYGQFDNWTDVDVFILKLVKSHSKQATKATWWRSLRHPSKGKLGDYFIVHVGPVVPHRNPEKGPSFAYIHAKTIPAWETVRRINERRRFTGTTFTPPFVAVRRTSRPCDKRAIATIIAGSREVAVENHIIVLFPNGKTITECRNLVRVLKFPQTDHWLDKRIRCRHLTVGALQNLPWWRI